MRIYKKYQIPVQTLAFKPELLAKHLKHNTQKIVTARDTIKGDLGDAFYIVGAGLYILAYVSRPMDMDYYAAHFCEQEGFGTPMQGGARDLLAALRMVYPDSRTVFAHTLYKVEDAHELLTLEK